MKRKKLNLPILLEFGDYHEIDSTLEYFQEVIPNIKAKEVVNYCEVTGSYGAIFYTGAQSSRNYRKLLEEVKKNLKSAREDEDFDYYSDI